MKRKNLKFSQNLTEYAEPFCEGRYQGYFECVPDIRLLVDSDWRVLGLDLGIFIDFEELDK